MTLLLIGLAMWVGFHLFPVLGSAARARLVARVGTGPYKGMFALLIVAAVVVIVLGWRAATPEHVYAPPAWGRHVTYLLVLLTFMLFVAARRGSNIKRVLRHPQLTGLVLWSIGHLLANGDSRSLVLFTTLGLWAVLEMVLISRRDGPWQKPAPLPWRRDLLVAVAGTVVFGVLLWAHPWFTGVRLLGGAP